MTANESPTIGQTIKAVPVGGRNAVIVEVARVYPVDGGFVVTGHRVSAQGVGVGRGMKVYYIRRGFEVVDD